MYTLNQGYPDFFGKGQPLLVWDGSHELVSKTTVIDIINRLTPNDPYMGRTAPLTSKRCIWYIYSTNIGTEYFKHALYSPFFFFKMQFAS